MGVSFAPLRCQRSPPLLGRGGGEERDKAGLAPLPPPGDPRSSLICESRNSSQRERYREKSARGRSLPAGDALHPPQWSIILNKISLSLSLARARALSRSLSIALSHSKRSRKLANNHYWYQPSAAAPRSPLPPNAPGISDPSPQ